MRQKKWYTLIFIYLYNLLRGLRKLVQALIIVATIPEYQLLCVFLDPEHKLITKYSERNIYKFVRNSYILQCNMEEYEIVWKRFIARAQLWLELTSFVLRIFRLYLLQVVDVDFVFTKRLITLSKYKIQNCVEKFNKLNFRYIYNAHYITSCFNRRQHTNLPQLRLIQNSINYIKILKMGCCFRRCYYASNISNNVVNYDNKIIPWSGNRFREILAAVPHRSVYFVINQCGTVRLLYA